MNWPVFSFVFTIASGTTIGVFMTIALITGWDEIPHIITAVLVGLAMSVPISYIVAKKMQTLGIARDKNAV